MRWLNTLERRFGSLAIPGLMRIVVAFNAFVFLLILSKPEFVQQLELRPDLVMRGEVWRLVSFIFIPLVNFRGGFNLLFVLLYLNFLWLLGEGLEQAWGSFKLNLFYLIGVVGTAAAAFLFNADQATGVFLNTSLFFAFATLFPDFQVLLFFILPVRVKWVALVSFGLLLLQVLAGSMATRLTILVSLANYLLFFGAEWARYFHQQGRTVKRRQQFQIVRSDEPDDALHHCKVCQATETTAPEKEFRVAADGEEYCLDHLPTRAGGEKAEGEEAGCEEGCGMRDIPSFSSSAWERTCLRSSASSALVIAHWSLLPPSLTPPPPCPT